MLKHVFIILDRVLHVFPSFPFELRYMYFIVRSTASLHYVFIVVLTEW